MEFLKCLVLENRRISGYADAKILLEETGAEEFFVVDLDGLSRGAYNLRLYSDLSKFFEITVLNFPGRTADLVDSIVSGASRVVVSSRLPDKIISDFLAVTEELVMNYSDMNGCNTFSRDGGKYYLSSRMVDFPFEEVFMYGGRVDRKGYVILQDFPDSVFSDI